jgi:cytochrome c556
MKNFIRVGMVVAGVALVLGASVVRGTAQEDKLAAIKTRQDFMKAQGADVKAVTAYVKGQGNQEAAVKAADDLAARAPKIMALFVPGTSATDFPGKTKAKPELWTDMDKVKAIPTALEAAEVKLVAAVKTGDRKQVGAALGAVGKNCGACHGEYRLK